MAAMPRGKLSVSVAVIWTFVGHHKQQSCHLTDGAADDARLKLADSLPCGLVATYTQSCRFIAVCGLVATYT